MSESEKPSRPTKDLSVIILTGLSGAGKSTALSVFEDLGFICTDGLPPDLIPEYVGMFLKQDEIHFRGITLGMDVRHSDFLEKWETVQPALESMGITPRIVFIECKTPILVRRYATTRRPHPLESETTDLETAILSEQDLLSSLRDQADLVVDTSDYSIHDLRRVLQEEWNFIRDIKWGLKIYLLSFGYKYGLPTEADLVFDLRFLPNPYFVESLRPLSGCDEAISEYVLGSESGAQFYEKLMDFLNFTLPKYAEEGRYRVTIAVGCTGGRHRSVAVAEAIYRDLKKSLYSVSLKHRHVGKEQHHPKA